MSFTLSGQQSLATVVGKLKTLKTPIHHAMQTLGQEWIKEIQQAMYSTPQGPGGHSLPGNAPAVSSGQLVSSFQAKTQGWHTIEVGTSVEYAPYLEHGTSRMEPRPIFGEQYYQNNLSNKFRDFIISEIEKYLR